MCEVKDVSEVKDILEQEVEKAEYKLRIADLEFQLANEKLQNKVWAERYSIGVSLKRDQGNENAFLRKKLEYRRNWSKVLTEEVIRLSEIVRKSGSFDEPPIQKCEHGVIVIDGGVAICDECSNKY